MHIPNGFLDPVTATATVAVSGIMLAFGWQRISKEISTQQPITLGLVAAFIFAVQMVNYSIGHFTSGHLIGATLAAVVCGPWAAGVLMTMVVAIQSLFFHDGGTLALGANILNMAIVAPAVGYSIYLFSTKVKTKRNLAIAFGAWASVVAASAVAALELAISGVAPPGALFSSMLSWHSLIAFGEAGITVIAVNYLLNVVPQMNLSSEVLNNAKN